MGADVSHLAAQHALLNRLSASRLLAQAWSSYAILSKAPLLLILDAFVTHQQAKCVRKMTHGACWILIQA